jgi:hypothetical protein
MTAATAATAATATARAVVILICRPVTPASGGLASLARVLAVFDRHGRLPCRPGAGSQFREPPCSGWLRLCRTASGHCCRWEAPRSTMPDVDRWVRDAWHARNTCAASRRSRGDETGRCSSAGRLRAVGDLSGLDGGSADAGQVGRTGLGWRAARREPYAGYPSLLLRARVSVSCTDLGSGGRLAFPCCLSEPLQEAGRRMRVMYERVAGIDVHK